MSRIVLSWLVFMLSATAFAQSDSLSLQLQTWVIEGQAPEFNMQAMNLNAFDPENRVFHYFSNGTYWQADLNTAEWSRQGRLELPGMLDWAVCDTLNDRMLLFKEDVSKVYRLINEGEQPRVERVDETAYGENQYSSYKFFDRQKANIYAFGGYGYWYFKNLITHYDYSTNQWLLVPVNHRDNQPKERWNAHGLYWDRRDRLIVMGGQGKEGGRQEIAVNMAPKFLDVWAFSFGTQTWKQLGRIDSTRIRWLMNVRDFGMTTKSGLQAVDQQHGLGLVARRIEGDGPATEMLGVDLETGDVARLPVDGWVNTTAEDVVNIFWDEEVGRFVVVTSVRRSGVDHLPLRFYKLPVNNPERVKSWIREHSLLQPVSDTGWTASLSDMMHWGGWFLIGLLLGGGTVYLFRRRRNLVAPDGDHEDIEAGYNKADPCFDLEVRLLGSMELKNCGVSFSEKLGTKEAALVSLLVVKRLEGVEWMAIEDIEYTLWEQRMNRDYVRKLRNNAIDHINRVVEHLPGNDGDKPLIVNRKSRRDRRKLEYGLHPDLKLSYIDIRDDLELDTSHETVRFKWRGEPIDWPALKVKISNRPAVTYLENQIN